MAIYVDALMNWGWIIHGKRVASCHMFSDCADLEELHAFAEQLGLARERFQPHEVAPHYDLVKTRRDAALALGAVYVDRRRASAIWKARRKLVNAPNRNDLRLGAVPDPMPHVRTSTLSSNRG